MNDYIIFFYRSAKALMEQDTIVQAASHAGAKAAARAKYGPGIRIIRCELA